MDGCDDSPPQGVSQRSINGTLALGNMRGMQQLANVQGVITLTALDHRGSLRQILQRAMPDRAIGYAEVVHTR